VGCPFGPKVDRILSFEPVAVRLEAGYPLFQARIGAVDRSSFNGRIKSAETLFGLGRLTREIADPAISRSPPLIKRKIPVFGRLRPENGFYLHCVNAARRLSVAWPLSLVFEKAPARSEYGP
jgi:hypothetical protein